MYVILRIDDFHSADTALEDKVAVKGLVDTLDEAETECDRLNALHPGDDIRYFWRFARTLKKS